MERLLSTSVYKEVGELHIQRNKVCEDAVVENHSADGKIAAIVLCDGAGSYIHARDGAEIVSGTASELLVEQFEILWEYPEDKFAQHIIRTVCGAMEKKAAENGWTLESMSTTLLCAVMHCDGRYMVFHVGDGVVVGCSTEFDIKVLSKYVHDVASNISTFVNVPGTDYKVLRGTGNYCSFLLTSDGSEAYLFPNGLVAMEAVVLQEAAFVMSENGTNKLMADLTSSLKKRCKAYDDISFAVICDVRITKDILFRMDQRILSRLLQLKFYPERKKDQKDFANIVEVLRKHPEGVPLGIMKGLLYTHNKHRTVKRIRKFFSEDTVALEHGSFYLK